MRKKKRLWFNLVMTMHAKLSIWTLLRNWKTKFQVMQNKCIRFWFKGWSSWMVFNYMWQISVLFLYKWSFWDYFSNEHQYLIKTNLKLILLWNWNNHSEEHVLGKTLYILLVPLYGTLFQKALQLLMILIF